MSSVLLSFLFCTIAFMSTMVESFRSKLLCYASTYTDRKTHIPGRSHLISTNVQSQRVFRPLPESDRSSSRWWDSFLRYFETIPLLLENRCVVVDVVNIELKADHVYEPPKSFAETFRLISLSVGSRRDGFKFSGTAVNLEVGTSILSWRDHLVNDLIENLRVFIVLFIAGCELQNHLTNLDGLR